MAIIRIKTGNFTMRHAMHLICRMAAKFGLPLALAGAPVEVVTAVTALIAACQATGYDVEPEV